MNKKFAIFDMDGTLVDSMNYWNNLIFEFLETKKISNISQSVIEKINIMTMRESANLFINEFGVEGTVESVLGEMENLMYEHYKKHVSLKSGVKEYLEYLHNQNVKMCVASSTNKSLVDFCLKELGIREYFDFILSCETIGIGKNKPDIYYEAIKKFKTTPSETIVYEDAFYAIITAKNAGFYVAGVYDENEEFYWNKIKDWADKVIIDFKEEIK